jgi:hypothetical protein
MPKWPDSFMDSQPPSFESEDQRNVIIDWAAQEWFQVWLRLTGHNGQGDLEKPRQYRRVPEPTS